MTLSIPELKTICKKNGRPTKYDADKHIDALVEVFHKGGTPIKYCASVGISKRTLWDWLGRHLEFKEAYDIMFAVSQAYWEELPFKEKVDYKIWFNVMRNAFGYGLTKFRITKDMDAPKILDCIIEQLASGEMSAQEAVNISNLAVTKHNIVNNIQVDNRQSLIRSDDEIQERIIITKEKLNLAKEINGHLKVIIENKEMGNEDKIKELQKTFMSVVENKHSTNKEEK